MHFFTLAMSFFCAGCAAAPRAAEPVVPKPITVIEKCVSAP